MSRIDSVNIIIKSLNKAEVRNVRSFLKTKSSSRYYLPLFNRIKENPQIANPSLCKLLSVSSSQLSVKKNALKELILQQCRSANIGTEGKILGCQRNSDFYLKKGLIDLFQKESKKGIEISVAAEEFELALTFTERLIKTTQKNSDKIRNQEEDIRKVYDNFQSYYLKLRRKLAGAIASRRTPDPKIELTKSFLQDQLLKSITMASSNRAIAEFHRIRRVCFTFAEDFDNALRESEKFIRHYEKNPEMDRFYELDFIDELAFLVRIHFVQGNFNESELFFLKLSELEARNPVSEAVAFEKSAMIKVKLSFEMGNRTEGHKWAQLMGEKLDSFTGLIEPERIQFIAYLLGRYFFAFGDIQQAKKWCNKVVLIENYDTRSPSYLYALSILLMCHIELNDSKSFDYYAGKLQYYIRTRKPENSFPKTTFRFLNALNKKADGRSTIFDQIINWQKEVNASPGERKESNYLDFFEWAKSKQQACLIVDLKSQDWQSRKKKNDATHDSQKFSS